MNKAMTGQEKLEAIKQKVWQDEAQEKRNREDFLMALAPRGYPRETLTNLNKEV